MDSKVTTSEWYGGGWQTHVDRDGVTIGYVRLEPPFARYDASAHTSAKTASRAQFDTYAEAVAWIVAEHEAVRVVAEQAAAQ